MRTFLVAAFSLATASAAFAADLPYRNYYTAPAPLAFSWAGPYLGLNAGYEWGSVSNSGARPSGVAGGLEGGYNWQSGQFVFGAEADLQGSAANDKFAAWKFSNPWFGTLRGRAGMAFNNVLVFGTAGLAYGDLSIDRAGLYNSQASLGWVGGAGIEIGFTPHWSAKAEWLYLDLSNRNYSLTRASNGLAANLLRMGVNYRF